jgi:hypothetical protein
VLSNKFERIGLTGDGIQKLFRRHRICLASFYPNEIPEDINNYDVDHIDGNHHNNVLSNLQWLSKNEHRIKTNNQTQGKRRSTIENTGKKVKIIEIKGNGNNDFLGKIFNSSVCAGKELRLKHKLINKSARNGYWVNSQYKFKYVTEELFHGEIFKPLGNYKISNKGRIKMRSGKITYGSFNKLSKSKYRTVGIKLEKDTEKKSYPVHRLVWMAFNGPIPEGKVIMHNDTYNTLDKEGCERNWLEDLSLGTQKENMQSYHDNKSDTRGVRCVDTDEDFISAGEAGRKLNLDAGLIAWVCQKKRKTTGGFKFEYIN